MQLIGIDIGTTSICAVAIDKESGALLQKRSVNSEADMEGKYPFEKLQDTEKIITLARSLLDELLTEDTVSIGVTGQMHGIVYLDADGRALSPLYTWQDKRADEPYADGTYASHLGIFAGYGCASDFYNRERGIRPTLATAFCTIHDYFVMTLTGRKVPLIHTTDAASLGCFEEESLTFSYDCSLEVTADYTIAGTYRGIPVGVAIGDNQASVLSTLTDEDSLLLNFGTGSQISLVSAKRISAKNIECRPYFEGKHLIVGSALCGGRAYSILCDFYHAILSESVDISKTKVYNIMEQMLLRDTEATLTVDTRFAGTREDSDIRGSITGISTENLTPAALTRGVLCGMVEELYGMYREMGEMRSSLTASGNAIRKNPALQRIVCDRFESEPRIPYHTEEGAYGAALFGALCANVFASITEAQALIRFQ